MTDLSRILDDLLADLGGEGALSLPTLPTSLPTSAVDQVTEINRYSHTSHTSHTENEAPAININTSPSNADVSPGSARVTSSCVESVGSVGSVGRGAKTLAGSTLPFFPQDLEDVGSVGREGDACERPLLDLNRAGPQRSDWWTGAAMAKVDRLAPPPGDPLPISPSDVRAGVARELRALADLGRDGPEAMRDAIAITAAKIRNASALAESQAMDNRCHVCGDALDGTRPEIAVMQGGSTTRLHMHSACHAGHSARRKDLVARIMAAAGYGDAQKDGDAV